MRGLLRWRCLGRRPVVAALSAALTLWLLLACGAARAGKAHEHGVGKLNITQDGAAAYTLELELPLDSLVGFERPPRTAPERQAAEAAKARLRDAAMLFRVQPVAGCAVQLRELSVPVWEVMDRGTSAGKGVAAHADAHAAYGVQCPPKETIQGVEVHLFEAFPRLKRLQVQAALTNGQRLFRLTPTQRRVDLGP